MATNDRPNIKTMSKEDMIIAIEILVDRLKDNEGKRMSMDNMRYFLQGYIDRMFNR